VGSNAQTQRRFERSAVTLTRMEVMRTGEVCGLEIHESDFHSAAGCQRDGDALPLSGRSSAQVHRLQEQDFYGTAGCLRGQGALLHAGRSRAQGHRLRAKARWFRRGKDCWSGPPGLARTAEDTTPVHSGETGSCTRASLEQEDNFLSATRDFEGEENHSKNVEDDQENHSGNTNDEPELFHDYAEVVYSADKMPDASMDCVIQHVHNEGEDTQKEGCDDEEKVAYAVDRGFVMQPDNKLQHMVDTVAGAQVSTCKVHELDKVRIAQPPNMPPQVSKDDEKETDAVDAHSDLLSDNVLHKEEEKWACIGSYWGGKSRQQESKWAACTQAAEVAIRDALGRKDKGNTALANGKPTDAAQLYMKGLSRIGRHCTQYENCSGEACQRLVSTCVALHNNLALALLRIAERAEIAPDTPGATAWYAHALESTSAVLALEPHNAKAQHRRQIAVDKIEKLGIDKSLPEGKVALSEVH